MLSEDVSPSVTSNHREIMCFYIQYSILEKWHLVPLEIKEPLAHGSSERTWFLLSALNLCRCFPTCMMSAWLDAAAAVPAPEHVFCWHHTLHNKTSLWCKITATRNDRGCCTKCCCSWKVAVISIHASWSLNYTGACSPRRANSSGTSSRWLTHLINKNIILCGHTVK